ncbi:MAG TPA: response regulator [Burkholderiaceae bacterium]|jgi:CheY-like chemotaxis protein|nr:response regulator [Burkholderiaceae bacterium]
MKRILIVEDQSDIRQLIRTTLEFDDYEIFEADNGPRGLQMALAMRPALVLLDVMMPGELDGYQVCERIKRDPATSLTRVVLLTARGQRADLEQGKKAGCDSYLIKPFSPLALIDLLDKLLADPQEN